ncbi:MAG: hypothetical protein A2W61_08475 [Deltaproteobacteria bacterium RIFCSPLOWO2_01_44_7]|nr:MAG: hypothetical protein A2712_10970 [Deltaproteobacteria bacterium RIFCSPHIGHO2_01_FULL_43_49]OGQ16575.1 MAG: hypothetical protein A3D22_06670 [Deltaproteobacteria bacterium RIFCSPHIGHO2_02_FULL_44_53]OGQ28391.1 MAG: hypothetical protein A3D98_06375 [Deltaproteobacteria bacterium RIFCSPHIGHO2_12_FULL_44_21]OGQ32462.1 MAG: hypothetical protein A2979_10935 [Deltaproteobacteria bacterium RIFCSPLOWO2_01_FULL_45_74]OGQ39116.1 MAG: hypothetical protein A2W61_08475 [Deltaproteobacteria bacterium 
MEYIHNENFSKKLTVWNQYDGYSWYATQRDLEALWGLCTKLPEDLGIILVRNLPVAIFSESTFDNKELISEDVLDHFAKSHLLSWLLYRNDVRLSDYRKKILFDDRFSKDQKEAAASQNLDLNNDEFEKLLGLGGKFIDLICLNSDLKLVFLQAAKDYDKSLEKDSTSHWEDLSRNINQRRKCLGKEQLEREERELRIYEVARELVPWKKEKPDEEALQSSLPDLFNWNGLDGKRKFKDAIVPGNTWGTFVNLKNLISKNYKIRKIFEKIYFDPEPFDGDFGFLSDNQPEKDNQSKRGQNEKIYVWILLAFIIGYLLRGCG